MYRDPSVSISDIEVMIGKSYGTAKRVMARLRKHYNLAPREKPTMQMLREYLEEI